MLFESVSYTCVGVFIATAIITVLSVINIIKIDADQKNKLFTILIVEIVGIGIAIFMGLVKLDSTPVTNQLAAGNDAGNNLQSTTQKLDDVRKVLSDTNETLILLDTSATSSAQQQVQLIKPRVYIHISDEGQRPQAKQAQSAIQTSGDLAPGIQNVGANSPNTAELRYFVPSDAEDGKRILQTINGTGLNAKLKFIPGYDISKIRPKHFELWLSKS